MSDTETDIMAQVIEEAKSHNTKKCTADECFVCGYMACPAKCIEHYFHDGCPVCDVAEPKRRGRK